MPTSLQALLFIESVLHHINSILMYVTQYNIHLDANYSIDTREREMLPRGTISVSSRFNRGCERHKENNIGGAL